MSRLSLALAVLLIFCSFSAHAQPHNDLEWHTSVSLSSDTLAITCANFVVPFDVGRILDDPTPIVQERGEMSETLRSPHDIKVTLQPQTGTSDTLSTISGCSRDGASILLSTQDAGDTITLVETGNIEVPGTSLALDDPEVIVRLVLRASVWTLEGGVGTGGASGSGCTSLSNCFDIDNELSGITDAVPLILTDIPGGDDAVEIGVQAEIPFLEGRCNDGPCDTDLWALTGKSVRLMDNGTLGVEWDGDAALRHDKWKFQPGYELLMSKEVVLYPEGDCAHAEQSVNSSGIGSWITCADTVGDALAFDFKIMERFTGITAVTIILWATNTNGSATGTLSFQCTAQSVRTGINIYTSHITTGQQTLSITFGAANRSEASTATFNLNDIVGLWAHVKGKCVVSAAPSQIADVRISGTGVVQLLADSFSD